MINFGCIIHRMTQKLSSPSSVPSPVILSQGSRIDFWYWIGPVRHVISHTPHDSLILYPHLSKSREPRPGSRNTNHYWFAEHLPTSVPDFRSLSRFCAVFMDLNLTHSQSFSAVWGVTSQPIRIWSISKFTSRFSRFGPLLPMILASYLNRLWEISLPLLAFYIAIHGEVIRVTGSDGGFWRPAIRSLSSIWVVMIHKCQWFSNGFMWMTVMTSNMILSGPRRFELDAISDDLCGRPKH
jgi:hypothetical protein